MDAPDGRAAVGVGLEHVTVVLDRGTVVLRDVTLSVPRGEILTIVGPSGSGKTTLLRAVAGLAPLTSGEVVIGGRAAGALPVQARDLAMVFESGALMPMLDVAGNLAFGLQVRHVPEPEVRERVEAEARQMRISRLLGRRPATLSAGERGRVGMGRALIRVPTAWLLDEPLAHFDAKERFTMRRQLVRHVRQGGATTLYVTHDPVEAMAVGDRVAVLRDGTVAQVAPPRELYRRPVDVFVAVFVGTPLIGLVPARVVGTDRYAGFQVGDRVLPLWAPLPPEAAGLVGRDVVLGIRPEDVHDADEQDDPGFARLAGSVVVTELAGPDVWVTVEVDAPAVTAPGTDRADARAGRARLRARFPRHRQVPSGSRVTMSIELDRAHLFDPVTGRAIWHVEVPR